MYKIDDVIDKQANKIITLITEVSEHFKETFKKFGALTINEAIWKSTLAIIDREKKGDFGIKVGDFVFDFSKLVKNSHFLFLASNLSLLVPIFFAFYRITKIRAMLEDIEVEE